jgi:hypothetical protein
MLDTRIRLRPRLWLPMSLTLLGLLSTPHGRDVHAEPLHRSSVSEVIAITTPQGAVILAELADTPEKRARGLMFRSQLESNRGMLFAFSDSQAWSFWMKNTRIPLDIIWMDHNKRIVHIERNVPPCSRTDESCPQYQPAQPALYVLELAAGSADALRLDHGAVLRFQLPSNLSAQPSSRQP